VLQSLGRVGIVEARRGLGGGYVLSRPLGNLTVYDVVNAVDPLKRIRRCPLRLKAHAGRLCSLHQRLDDAVAMLEAYFKETTIASLLSDRSSSHVGPLCEISPDPGDPGKSDRSKPVS
jgi:Rrf2 family protein